MYQKELNQASEIAREVGNYLRKAQETTIVIKQPHGEGYLDATTKADLEAETMVLEAIARSFPNDHILSEETRTEYSPSWKRLWIIDPLDGTTNYLKGLDTYAVSIAFAHEGKVVVAAICLPVSGDIYSAVEGCGVLRNGAPLNIASQNDTLAKSLVSVGFPHVRDVQVANRAFDLYKNVWLVASDLRRSASAVYDGTLLARGATGAYITPDIKPWDIAATALFVREQGGDACDFDGQPLDLFRKDGDRFSTSAIFAKNTAILADLKEMCRDYNHHQ